MATRPHAQGGTRPAPRLYLVTPELEAAHGLAEALAAAVAAADVAAVLVRLGPGDDRSRINVAKALAGPVQAGGAALLIDGHPELVARAGADGAHLSGIAALQAALPALKPDRIAGVGGLTSRHDAMLAGEAGADYVMFGEPEAGGARSAFDATLERIAWWAEIFELPCVGFAADLDEVGALAGAGADFVVLGEWLLGSPEGAAATVARAAGKLRRDEAVA